MFIRNPSHVQKIFDSKIRLFMDDIQYPSLRVKKMQGQKKTGGRQAFQCFTASTFEVHADFYLLRRIGPHDDVLKKP